MSREALNKEKHQTRYDATTWLRAGVITADGLFEQVGHGVRPHFYPTIGGSTVRIKWRLRS
jgi:hypothetical protein